MEASQCPSPGTPPPPSPVLWEEHSGKAFSCPETRNRSSWQLSYHLASLPLCASDSCVLLKVIRFLSPRIASSSKPGVLNSLAYRGRHVRQMRAPAPGAVSLEGTLLRLAERPRNWKSRFSWDAAPVPISGEKTPEEQNASVQGLWDPGCGTCPPTSHVPRRVAGSAGQRFPQHLPPTRRWERALLRPLRVLRPVHRAARAPAWPSLNAGLVLQDAPQTLRLAGTSPSLTGLCGCPSGEPGEQSAGDDPGGTPRRLARWAGAPQHVPGGWPGLLSQWRFPATAPTRSPSGGAPQCLQATQVPRCK